MSCYFSNNGSRKRAQDTDQSRLGILLLGFLVLLTACSSSDNEEVPNEQPNIVLVLVDALRWDHLGFAGYDKPTTPYLDSLAEEAVVFDYAYSHCSKTLASTASLLTGTLFPTIVHVQPNDDAKLKLENLVRDGHKANILSPQQPTFIETMAANGYDTVGVLTNPHHHSYSGFPDLFDFPLVLFDGWKSSKKEPYIRGEKANDSLKSWVESRTGERPIFAYIHYMDVHWPYQPVDRFKKEFVTTQGKDRYLDVVYKGGSLSDPADLEFMKQSYDAEIRYVDSMIQELHQFFKKVCSRPTILMVTSDHGEEFMDHGCLGHGRTLELELIRVPLLIHGVAGVDGHRVDTKVRQIDVGPTMLELAKIDSVPIGDGESFLNRILSPKAVAPIKTQTSVARYRSLYSLTVPGWHMVYNKKDGSRILYDTSEDPLGTRNIAAREVETAEEFEVEIASYIQRQREMVREANRIRKEQYPDGAIPELSQKTREQLAAIGYLP